MKKTNRILAVAIGAAVACACSSFSAPMIGYTPQQTWSSDAGGWVDGPIDTTITTSWNPGGYLDLSVVGSPAGFGLAKSGPSDSNFKGNLRTLADYDNSALSVQFKFITTGNTPGALSFYFQGLVSGRQWSYDLMPAGGPVANGVTTYNVTIGSFAGWNPENGGLTASDFYTDLADVAWVGLYVQGNGPGTQVFGLDDMYLTLAVPEPETVWMILAVILSLGITFRSRLVGMMDQMKTRLYKA